MNHDDMTKYKAQFDALIKAHQEGYLITLEALKKKHDLNEYRLQECRKLIQSIAFSGFNTPTSLTGREYETMIANECYKKFIDIFGEAP